MVASKKDIYDVIIIGGGVGGLTCGCFLAKAGKKVLIIEKNPKIGGYCNSFKQNGFTFDFGIRALSHSKEDSYLYKIIKEDLNLNIELIKTEITDCIITPDYKINFYSDINRTIDELISIFPKESKNINLLFDLINNINKNSILASFYQEFKNRTFKYLLDKYFKNEKLKFILTTPIGNLGLSSFEVSAISSIMLYHGYLFKGGHYIKGGMQTLVNALLTNFKKHGGKILLSNKVYRIEFIKNNIKKIFSNNRDFFYAKEVVCNCDPSFVISNLISKNILNKKYFLEFKKLKPSTSAFILYLGLKDIIRKNIDNCCGLWYYFNYKFDDFYFNLSRNKINFNNINHLLFAFPSFHDKNLAPKNCESIMMILWSPYKNKNFWYKNAKHFKEILINKAKNLIPNLSSIIQVEKITSPVFLNQYTLSRNGSVRGWEALPSQLRVSKLLEEILKKRIFFVGQWSTHYAPGGLFTAIFSAKKIANIILTKTKEKK